MVAEAEHELLTIREAAAFLRVSEVTISRWIKQGRLPGYRIGPRAVRIRRDELDEMVVPAPESADPEAAPIRTARGLKVRRLSDEEIAQRLAAFEETQRLRDHFSAQRGGIPLPSSTEIIADERRKRTEQLAG